MLLYETASYEREGAADAADPLLVYVFLSKRIQDSFIAGAIKG